MVFNADDTIAAISTPLGMGGIGVVRLSGKTAFVIAKHLSKIENPQTHSAYHVWLPDDIDEIVMTFFKGPKSYTGEDVVEISCHGSPFVVQKILALALSSGARQAGKGEFTKRAFLNGKVDLIQAESVLSLISSQTEAAAKISTFQLHGKFSRLIDALKLKMLSILSEIQGAIDFPEDIGHELKLIPRVTIIFDQIDSLLSTYPYGKLLRNGVNVVIVGKPNVGKSSLLNALLRESRAIVTNIPGTTRDAIIESLNIGGVQFNLIDTAGIHETTGTIEKEGIAIAKRQIDRADLILLVFDASAELDVIDEEVKALVAHKPCMAILNKVDLGVYNKTEGLFLSAQTGHGIAELETAMLEFVVNKKGKSPDIVLMSERQADCLRKAKKLLQEVISGIKIGASLDIISTQLQEGVEALSEMLGARVGDEVLDKLFSEFCVGK